VLGAANAEHRTGVVLEGRARLTDPIIEQIEADLHEARFSISEVERFLANRHQAKIDSLTATRKSSWRQIWGVAKEVATILSAFIGYITIVTVAGLWLLTGEWPIG
jgi:RNA-binding protein YhbY